MDYTNWTNDELGKLRSLQRDDGASTDEIEAVEHELRRRTSPAAGGPAPVGATVPVSGPSSSVTAPAVAHRHTAATTDSLSTSTRRMSKEPPFDLVDGRRSFISAMTTSLVLVALLTGVGTGIGIYSISEGLGSARLLVTCIAALSAATPYFVVVAFMMLASETAQGVTWIAHFLHEQTE